MLFRPCHVIKLRGMGGDLKLTRLVLDAGGDVNPPNLTHATPLVAAASKGQVAAVAWSNEQRMIHRRQTTLASRRCTEPRLRTRTRSRRGFSTPVPITDWG